MNEMLILGAILLGSWVGLLLLRVPSSIAFLSLLIGQLLSSQASSDVYDFAGAILHIEDIRYVQMALLLLPLVLTVLFLRGRVSKHKLLIEAVPSFFVVALTLLLLAPMLDALKTVLDIAAHDQLNAYKSVIVIAASISGLVSAWLSYPKAHKDHDKHGK